MNHSQDSSSSPGFDTTCIHAGFHPDEFRSHVGAIYPSSTYLFDSAEQAVNIFSGKEEAFVYSRFGNPTIRSCEEKIAALESYGLFTSTGDPLPLKALLHASGMAAITTLLLSTLKSGDQILTHYSLYGGTQELIDKVLPGLGIEALIFDLRKVDGVEEQLKNPKIKLLYLETPANPTVQCVDIEKLTQLAHQHGKIVAVDNTFATPYLQQPFRFGVDYVMHSTTKFLNGHGTAIGGVLLGPDINHMKTVVTKHHRLLGGNSNAFDAFLLNNGMKTLGLRMERHCSNAEAVATFLEQHPKVAKVNYLGLNSHPDYALARKQMKHAGALLSFELKNGFDGAKRFLNALKMCSHAVSLGTCDTLLSHPASTTHVGVDPEKRKQSGISDGLIRMSVGIESLHDILNDLDQALNT